MTPATAPWNIQLAAVCTLVLTPVGLTAGFCLERLIAAAPERICRVAPLFPPALILSAYCVTLIVPELRCQFQPHRCHVSAVLCRSPLYEISVAAAAVICVAIVCGGHQLVATIPDERGVARLVAVALHALLVPLVLGTVVSLAPLDSNGWHPFYHEGFAVAMFAIGSLMLLFNEVYIAAQKRGRLSYACQLLMTLTIIVSPVSLFAPERQRYMIVAACEVVALTVFSISYANVIALAQTLRAC